METGPSRAIGSMSNCRSRGREFDPGPTPHFGGDQLRIIFDSHLPPFADSRRAFVSYKRKHVCRVLVNLLVKLAQEKKRCG